LKEPKKKRSKAKLSEDKSQEQLPTMIGILEDHASSLVPSPLDDLTSLEFASKASYPAFDGESFELEKSKRAFSPWNVYEYAPLAPNHIRLLRFKPSPLYAPWGVSFDLIHVPLDKLPPYEALSYRWSEGAKDKVSCGGRSLYVSTNCKAALKRLNEENRMLWVDSICINQHNIMERNHQITLMAQIYSRAERTLAWLGEDKDLEASCLADINGALPYLRGHMSTSSTIADVRLFLLSLRTSDSFCVSNLLGMSILRLPLEPARSLSTLPASS
jgi:hypothetical protein